MAKPLHVTTHTHVKKHRTFFFSLVENWIFVNVRKWQINSNQKLTSMSSTKLNIFSRYDQKSFEKNFGRGKRFWKTFQKESKAINFQMAFLARAEIQTGSFYILYFEKSEHLTTIKVIQMWEKFNEACFEILSQTVFSLHQIKLIILSK